MNTPRIDTEQSPSKQPTRIKPRHAVQHAHEFSMETRFRHGSFSVTEVCKLANISQNKFYLDVKAGLIATFKRGRSTCIAGPNAAKYLGINLEK